MQLAQYQKNNVLNKVNYAWSKTNGEYIQDQIIKEKKDIQKWIETHNAVIYICGSQKGFGESVLTCIKEILTPTQIEEHLLLDLY